MSIPFFSIDLKFKDYWSIFSNIINPFNKKKLEKKLKEKITTRYPNKFISLLPSGRLGFYLSLKYFFNKDDIVLFSSMSFPLYIKIALELELKVKLVDVSENDLNIDVNKLEREISNDKCKGLVVTHLFGNPCEIAKIKQICNEKGIILIEDCAQSFNSQSDSIETGNFGDVGVVSTSLLKIPTTLSGGILITKNYKFNEYVENWCKENLNNNFIKKINLFFKIFIFILNSYPIIYSILSDKVFSFLKNYNPRIYRKILYSGMGMKEKKFDPRERPNLSKFQLSIGLSQIERCEKMNELRRLNSKYLQDKLSKCKNIKIINNHFKSNWNHQYFVITIENEFQKIFKKIFDDGVHAMDENVWNCLKYDFNILNKGEKFENTFKMDGKLLRIQNNSFLSLKKIDYISNIIINASEKYNKI
jgi:dTDP-4-amino-4,6-dideoxygalactose transaminase